MHVEIETTYGKSCCTGCGEEFVACRSCYVAGSGMAVWHALPECPITDEEWARVVKREMEDAE